MVAQALQSETRLRVAPHVRVQVWLWLGKSIAPNATADVIIKGSHVNPNSAFTLGSLILLSLTQSFFVGFYRQKSYRRRGMIVRCRGGGNGVRPLQLKSGEIRGEGRYLLRRLQVSQSPRHLRDRRCSRRWSK
jgi:hypothetical protein